MRTLVLLALVVGCGSRERDRGGHYEIDFDVPKGTTIVLAGKAIGTTGERPLQLDLPAGAFLSDGKHPAVARVETACGPREVPLAPQFGRIDEDVGRYTGIARVKYGAPTLEWQRVRLDRTRAPNAKIEIGPVVVNDGDRFVWPDCDAARKVTVDGKQVGMLPAEQPPEVDLVIAAAPTCYQETLVNYSEVVTLGSDGNRRVFDKTQVLFVRHIDHFLESAPSTIESSHHSTSRNELLAVTCPKSRAVRARARRSR